MLIGRLEDAGDDLECVLHALNFTIIVSLRIRIFGILVGLLELVGGLLLIKLEPLVHPLNLALRLIG